MATPHRQALLVLGMHRSGTSALGGVLARLGAQAPNTLMPSTEDNPRGYWESVQLMGFHDRLLASAGSRWNDWSRFNPDWLESMVALQFREELPGLIEREFGASRMRLIKDPRTCRFLPFWLQVLDSMAIDARIVIPVRHPLEVARSLEARDGSGRAQGLLLWLRHVLDAEFHSRNRPRALVPYEALLDDWQAQVRRLSRELQVKWPRLSPQAETEIDEYLSTLLRRNVASDSQYPDSPIAGWARLAHGALLDLASGTSTSEAMAVLDRVRDEFDRSSAIYAAPLFEQEAKAAADLKVREQAWTVRLEEVSSQLRDTTESLQARGAEVESLRAAVADRDATLERTEAAHQADVAHMRNLVAAREAENGRLEGERARLESEHRTTVSALQAEVSERDAERVRLQVEQQSTLSGLQARLEERETERARVMAEHQALMESLVRKLAESEAEGGRLRAELQAQVDALAAARTAHDAATAELRAHVARLGEDLGDLGARLQAREAENGELIGQLSRLNSIVSEQVGQVGRMQQSLVEVEGSLDERFREIAKLTEMVFQLEESEASSMAESRQKDVQLEFARALLRSAEQRLATGRADVENDALRLRSPLKRLRFALGNAAPRLMADPLQAQADILAHSDLFDREWYLAQHPEIGEVGLDPIRHYLEEGALAGFDPGPHFSTLTYLSCYPDVRAAGINPLVHFLEYGRKEGRRAPAREQA